MRYNLFMKSLETENLEKNEWLKSIYADNWPNLQIYSMIWF